MASGARVLVRDTFIITSKRERAHTKTTKTTIRNPKSRSAWGIVHVTPSHEPYHSCNANVSVGHRDRRTALLLTMVIAKGNLAVGKELVVTYVGPSLGVCERRSPMFAWGFEQCDCERCVKEEREGRSGEDVGEGEIKERSDMNDL